MQKLKIAFFGSPLFSADLLEKIILDKTLPIEVIFVVTQPDKPVGRKQIMTPSPVKVIANKYRIETDSDIFSTWGTKKVDIALVYAYGEIIPKKILSLPKYGFWNIHPSLLPLYRGASPIAYPLVLGDITTGVSLILMDEEMDHGPILRQEKMDISPTDSRTDLERKLTNLGFNMFKNAVNKLKVAKNAFKLTPQNHSLATYTKKLSKSDGYISLSILKKVVNNKSVLFSDLPEFVQKYTQKYHLSSTLNPLSSNFFIFNLFRGLSPWPGIWTLINLKGHEVRLKITEMKMVDNKPTITKVQLEGKKEVDFFTFQKAYSLF